MRRPAVHSAFASLIGIGIGIASASASERDPPKLDDFDWTTITPSTKLEYHPCYKEFQCARLKVPLDWLDETNEHTVALAITKLPAKVPDDDPAFGGTIFTNPGGPGGSGVGLMLREGHILQDTADAAKKYEILSWDPRGIQFTSPRADCYEDLLARDTDSIQRLAIGPLDSSPDALRRHWARTHGYGKLCTQNAGNGSIIPYASTASVVRDMVEMLDKIQELRDEEAAAKVAGGDERAQKSLELRSAAKQVPRIQYWGFSYGSILGNTFASMYPGRVGRIIVDGIADPEDYMAGGWRTNLQDTEELVRFFYETCFASAGKCALRRPSDKGWQDIRRRVEDLVKQLDDAPVAVLDGKLTNILTGYDVTLSFKNPLYTPYREFPKLAEKLNSAIEGNYTALLEAAKAGIPRLDQACSHPNASESSATFGDGGQAVLCSDGEDSTNFTIADYQAYVSELESQSPTFAGYWSQIRLACTGWRARPKWRFAGPFTTPEHDPAGVEGKPAAPLLFMSSRLDPVTPLRNALKASAQHPGSAVVIQESVGHCAIATGSRCSTEIIQKYFEHGTVPTSGTVCQADCDVWGGDDCLPSGMGIRVAPLAPPHDRSHPLVF
ncbi:Putative peptidase S33 tripeptidyl aminopeptidase-like, alpha/Beta hydrolase [Colletotrichum destructivum]|uniref:Peptidase S33 tripeptidyl aminopeptidase-like, alpha/Beta hydrolase n=1 Tax=Colletotrichum destructivum TaxID=34406 RepID=A0AAX4INK5_9PEZI|nr:Putative peptidase S33 tripeptidyl aminopeptidase-like, alpha/Beta hydrolase [Colletotrichum destructivum]